jgi:hypothetical protein
MLLFNPANVLLKFSMKIELVASVPERFDLTTAQALYCFAPRRASALASESRWLAIAVTPAAVTARRAAQSTHEPAIAGPISLIALHR